MKSGTRKLDVCLGFFSSWIFFSVSTLHTVIIIVYLATYFSFLAKKTPSIITWKKGGKRKKHLFWRQRKVRTSSRKHIKRKRRRRRRRKESSLPPLELPIWRGLHLMEGGSSPPLFVPRWDAAYCTHGEKGRERGCKHQLCEEEVGLLWGEGEGGEEEEKNKGHNKNFSFWRAIFGIAKHSFHRFGEDAASSPFPRKKVVELMGWRKVPFFSPSPPFPPPPPFLFLLFLLLLLLLLLPVNEGDAKGKISLGFL